MNNLYCSYGYLICCVAVMPEHGLLVTWGASVVFCCVFSSGILRYREISLPLTASSARGCLLERSLFRGQSCMVKPIVACGSNLVCESMLCTTPEYMTEYECGV